MANLFAELKRRHIYRVAAAYAVVAWVLLQLVNNVAPVLDLPVWVARAFLLLLVIGFPVAMFFVWMRELAPADGATARAATGKFDWALMGALIVVIALVSYQQLASSSADKSPPPGTPSPVATTGGISIAVLPFVNLSDDRAQEFFSDGMTEEITSALAKIPSLRVVARTSAFQFKGQNQDMRAVGQALGANHLIEGSVRKAGDRLRITAQLIKVDDGTHLWTENYDRQLTDIFAIQEEIAQAIATSLRVPLGLKQGESLIPSRATNLDSYQDYLRAKALVRARGLKPLTDAAALLEQVVARDPDYAPAWALLAQAYSLAPLFSPGYGTGSVEEIRRLRDVSLPRAEVAAQRAIQLDRNGADGYAALGFLQFLRREWLNAENSLQQALMLDSGNLQAVQWRAVFLAVTGRAKQALPFAQRLLAIEPLVPVVQAAAGHVLWVNGQEDAVIAAFNTLPLDFPQRGFFLSAFFAAKGRYAQAADVLLETPENVFLLGVDEEAARVLRTTLRPASSASSVRPLGMLSFVYLYTGAPERALEPFETYVDAGYLNGYFMSHVWQPSYAGLRKTERFKALMRNAGLVDYWRVRGWPDLCRPVGADDFVCD